MLFGRLIVQHLVWNLEQSPSRWEFNEEWSINVQQSGDPLHWVCKLCPQKTRREMLQGKGILILSAQFIATLDIKRGEPFKNSLAMFWGWVALWYVNLSYINIALIVYIFMSEGLLSLLIWSVVTFSSNFYILGLIVCCIRNMHAILHINLPWITLEMF